jgi:HEAT repeat protein
VAVPPLVALLRDADPPTAAAAAAALGRIGGPTAIAALRRAPPSPTVFDALLALAGTLSPAEGAALAEALAADSRWPAHDRAAAAQTSLDLEPARAAARIVEFLASDRAAFRQTALGLVGTSHAPGLVAALDGAFYSLDLSIQPAVLAALSRRADAAATPLVLGAAHRADPGVRAAAITALGSQPGDVSLVIELGRLALAQDADEARTARAALARLHGPGVTAAILAGATSGDAASRAVFIDQLAARNVAEGLPLLRHCRNDPNPAIRLAALNALATLAPPEDQSLLLDWLLKAPSEEERSRALRSVASVTQRNPDTTARARPVFEALEKSPPAIARTLLPLLLRLGGRETAECAARLALRSDTALSTAAVATLARWPDATAQASLVTVATSVTARTDLRAAAAEAALRYYERAREPWLAADTERVARLLDFSTDLAIRARLVPLLGRAADRAAADLAERLQAEPALADLARSAATLIAANCAGPPGIRVSKNEEAAARIIDGSTATAWAAVLTPDLWLECDFRTSRPMHRLTFDQTGRAAEFPERLEIYVTDDPRNPGRPVATAVGQRNRTVVDLPPGTRGRYLIVKNTAERLSAMWSICELFID